jgi:hypothetical protein
MTNSKLANSGLVIMDVAVHQRGRTPIASAVLRNGLNKVVHILEFQDGECILINRDLAHQKCRIKNGEVIKSGTSSFSSWESRQDSLKSLLVKAMQDGFNLVKSQRTSNLPLLQVPLVYQNQIAA